jgi:hypothetical protein
MSRDVTFQVHFDSDRSMRVVVPGPEGPVDVGSTRESADVGRIAGEGVRSVFGSGQVDFALRVDRPPWLDESTLVRLAPADCDGISHPYGQVVGFLPVGGVMVVHPEAGAGVYAPESLTPVDPAGLPPGTVESIVRRTEREPRQP